MEGRNFVRKKSSLTRRRVLYTPQFERTRHYAGLMAKASKIGSLVYNQLPTYWRQFWMYQSFTGEALKMLKAHKKEQEIQELLLERYVKEVVEKQTPTTSVSNVKPPPKRAYQKSNPTYWTNKTIKARRRQVNKQRMLQNASLLARASKLASLIYRRLPLRQHKRCYYRKLVAMAMELLKLELCEADIIAELFPSTKKINQSDQLQHPIVKKKETGVINHSKGYRYFITTLHKRIRPEPEAKFSTFVSHSPSIIDLDSLRI